MPKDPTICHFPKHAGKPWEEVLKEDREYIEWLVFNSGDGPRLSDELYEYLVDLLEGT